MNAKQTWNTLRAIVDRHDFWKNAPVEFQNALESLLNKAVVPLMAGLSSPEDKMMFDKTWIGTVCSDLGIQVSGTTRYVMLRHGLIRIYEKGLQREFWQRVDLRREEEARSKEERKKYEVEIGHVLDELMAPHNKNLFTSEWIDGVASNLGIKVEGRNKRVRCQSALEQIYKSRLQHRFADAMTQRRAEAQKHQKAYSDFAGPESRKVFTKDWLEEVCRRLGVRPKGVQRATLFKDALRQIFDSGKERTFLELADKRRREFESQEQERERRTRDSLARLRAIYADVCDRRGGLESMERKLHSYFPESANFEERLKEFTKQFGIKVKRRKREAWLRKIAEELFNSHTAGAGLNL